MHDLQEGVTPSADAATDTHQLMRDLAEKYSSIDFPSQPYEKQQADAGLTIVSFPLFDGLLHIGLHIALDRRDRVFGHLPPFRTPLRRHRQKRKSYLHRTRR